MNQESIGRISIIKMLSKALLFLVLTGSLMQLDWPGLRDLGWLVDDAVTEHQLEMESIGKEDMLKQGWVYFNLGSYEDARKVMNKVLEKESNISAMYCLGLIDIKVGKYEEAIEKMELVAARSPRHAATKLSLGKAYYATGYYGQSRSRLEQAVRLEPTNEEARLWLGKAYIRLNRADLALAMLETVTHGKESAEAAALMKNLR